MPLSAGIAKAATAYGLWASSEVCRLLVNVDRLDTVDHVWPTSVVVDAVEPTCSDVAHEVQGAVPTISGGRRGRWHRSRSASSARVGDARLRIKPFVTLMSQLPVQRAESTVLIRRDLHTY